MSKVKICGIRRLEDVEYVNKYKPDYIGFIFAESKRRVSVDIVKALMQRLKSGIKTVGVFVNEDIGHVVEIAKQCCLDVVQIHGNENPEYIKDLKRLISNDFENEIEVWKAIRVKDTASIEQMEHFRADAFVLDTYAEGTYGGIGRVFDWSLAAQAKKYGRIFLAGGLNSQNVQAAVESVRPYGLDTSSGVETEGFKDEEKIKAFIANVRAIAGGNNYDSK